MSTVSFVLRAIATVLVAASLTGCSQDWEYFRHDSFRSAHQANVSALSDPAQVPSLHTVWTWTMPAVANPLQHHMFRASPVVRGNRVFIGGSDGYFYALDINDGHKLWQFPAVGPPLVSQFQCNPSSWGIASSAVVTTVNGQEAVIFGAPDQSVGSGLGEGRLFALNTATGALIWASDIVAQLTGLGGGAGTLHEQIGYSAPLVANNMVYVGIANHCDNPIQQGKVRAVNLADGHLVPGFNFVSAANANMTPRPGGGVWNSVAADFNAIYATTGNIASANPTEPAINHALSLLRLDKNTGAVVWKLQPVPFAMDGDPDWSAGATVMLGSCHAIVASTMKDGWTYGVDAGNGTPAAPSVLWQYPATGWPFHPGDGTDGLHGDIRFLRPGAAWGDVFITMAAGLAATNGTTRYANYGRLHAINACAAPSDRIRWIKDVPGTSGSTYRLGPPTVTRGIVYVGTDLGHIVAIADPTLFPSVGWRCSHPDVATANCVANGFTLVPDPAVLADVNLSSGAIVTEPVISRGRLFVATDGGSVFRLQP